MKELFHFMKRLYIFSGNILFLNLIGMIMVSILDGAGMLLLIPMLSISGIIEIGSASSMWNFLDFMKNIPQAFRLPLILGIYISLVIGQSLLEKSIAIRDVKLQQGFLNKLREETYQGLLFVKWNFFLKTRKSNLINSLTKDISRVGMGIKMFLLLVSNLIFTVIQIGFAFWLSPQVSSLVILCGLGLAYFSWKYVKQAKILGKQSTKLSRRYLAGVTDNLNGIKEIKANTLETSRVKWIKTLNKNSLSEQVKYIRLQTNSQISYKTALAFIITGFIFLTVTFFPSQPERLLVVILLFSRLWPRFVGIQSSLQQLSMTLPAFKVLSDLQNETNHSKELSLEDDGTEPLTVEKMIECRDVFFRYDKKNPKYALRNINLQIPVGKMTAIIGQSGAGKSTLVDILMGLNLPESGEVLVDGVPITSENLLAFRKTISFVPQDPFLFNTSIKSNLLLMAPNATKKKIWQALELAAADDFVRKLPKGIDTRVGDRGLNLSGGERQRLVLARAILRKPAILILDEATSALDTGNELKIQQALEQLKKEMTIIIIAHRPSTIQTADHLIELHEGEVVYGDRTLNCTKEMITVSSFEKG